MKELDKLHENARLAIESAERAAEPDLRKAAEYLAQAAKLGASQRKSAKAIGKSAAWVNMLLKWHKAGFDGSSPFHPPDPKRSSDEHGSTESRQPPTARQVAADLARANGKAAAHNDGSPMQPTSITADEGGPARSCYVRLSF
jgi:hypothetical protein